MTPWLDDGDVQLYHGDVVDVLRSLPAGVAQTCITSPPYWGLRDYGTGEWTGGDEACDHTMPSRRDAAKATATSTLVGSTDTQGHLQEPSYRDVCGRCGARRVDSQLGLEATPDQYVERMVAVFREVWRVLRDDGTVWLNLGDSYNAHPGGDGDRGGRSITATQGTGDQPQYQKGHGLGKVKTLKPKDLVGIPWRVAFALQQPWYAGRIRDERDRIWLAAILDAEGCIHIHRRKAGDDSGARFTRKDGTEARYARTQDTFGVMVSIDNTSRALIDRCAELIGQGSRYTHEAGTGQQQRKQTLYRLTLTGQQSRELLRELYPYLVAKRQQARIAYACPSSGEGCIAAHEAVKLLHNGTETTVDYPEPPTLFTPGWYLRSDIIWGKSNPMPESVTDRPTKAHEMLFLLSKRPRYFYDADAIREENASPEQAEHNAKYARVYEAHTERVANGQGIQPGNVNNLGIHARGGATVGRNRRSVWTIPTEPFPEAHFATYPQALVRPCIQAGTSEHGECSSCGAPWIREVETDHVVRADGGRPMARVDGAEARHRRLGATSMMETNAFPHRTTTGWRASCACDAPTRPQTVLDPFVGSGTTALVARNHARRCIGIDLSAEYLQIAARRLQQLSLLGDPA